MKPIPSQKINTWSTRMVESTLQRYTRKDFKWHYEHGLQVMAIQKAGEATGDERYLKFAAGWIDHFVQPDGTIRGPTHHPRRPAQRYHCTRNRCGLPDG